MIIIGILFTAVFLYVMYYRDTNNPKAVQTRIKLAENELERGFDNDFCTLHRNFLLGIFEENSSISNSQLVLKVKSYLIVDENALAEELIWNFMKKGLISYDTVLNNTENNQVRKWKIGSKFSDLEFRFINFKPFTTNDYQRVQKVFAHRFKLLQYNPFSDFYGVRRAFRFDESLESGGHITYGIISKSRCSDIYLKSILKDEYSFVMYIDIATSYRKSVEIIKNNIGIVQLNKHQFKDTRYRFCNIPKKLDNDTLINYSDIMTQSFREIENQIF